MKKKFDRESIYNNNFLKIKIRSYGEDLTDFHDKEIPKVESNYSFLAVILFDFVLRKMKNITNKCF